MSFITNRYASQDLFISEEFHSALGEFVSRSEKDLAPFARQVDAWWLAVGIGTQIGVRTPLSEKRVKFNDGAIFNADPWRVTHLELLALAEAGEEALNEPAQVVRIATEYANTGFSWLMGVLAGEPEATLTVMNRIDEYL